MKFYNPEFLRFLAAGAFNTILGYCLYVSFQIVMDYLVAYTLAYVTGIVVSYWINTKFVFRSAWSWRSLMAFPSVYLFQYLVGLLLIWLLVERFDVSEMIAPILVIPLTIPLTYMASRFIIKGRQHG